MHKKEEKKEKKDMLKEEKTVQISCIPLEFHRDLFPLKNRLPIRADAMLATPTMGDQPYANSASPGGCLGRRKGEKKSRDTNGRLVAMPIP